MNTLIGEYTIPNDVCDGIVSFYEENPQYHDRGHVTKSNGRGAVDLEVKDSYDMKVDPRTREPRFQAYVKALHGCLVQYEQDFMRVKIPMGIKEVMSIQKYYPPSGGFKKFHCERTCMEVVDRLLVFMTYLNDVDDGGETEFLFQDKLYKPVKGQTLIWSADWTHMHRGLPSPTQEKMIITGWVNMFPSEGEVYE